MSFGAGGLAQMTYNNNLNGNMGLPASGLSSRGANMKRLTISAPSVNEDVAQAPKSSRAQLLSGLRTQKNNSGIPGTAPATQSHFPVNRKSSPAAGQNQLAVPQTATAASFGQQLNVPGVGPRGHHYTPSQVLSPPSITLESEEADEQLDPTYYQELLRMNQHLAQQQERLKQQLVAVTQQAQQMGLNPQQAQYYAQMMAQQAGLYSQPMQMPQQQMVEPVAGQPGLFLITNPMTGQTQYYFDQNSAVQQMAYGMDMGLDQNLSHSPPPATPTFNKSFEPATNNHAKSNNWRSVSPPKHTSTPPTEEPVALPPQSANAWRPGHKKSGSLMPTQNTAETVKPAAAAPAAQGNFGPGQNREGEHPIRQPRGPPALDELIAKPTSKHEGSKNFASRQRRAALNNIISAGAARRSYGGSQASLSPTSERDELVFSSSAEDNDTASIRSGGSTQRAIGSEKKEREERESRERERKNSFEIETKSVSSEEGIVDVQSRMGALGLDNKEQRRSAIQGLKGAAGQRRSMMF